MAKLIAEKDGYSLSLDVEYYNILDIECFSRMMKNPSYCYKFYWLEAIVQLISQGVKETTFDAVIDEMISNAWYLGWTRTVPERKFKKRILQYTSEEYAASL